MKKIILVSLLILSTTALFYIFGEGKNKLNTILQEKVNSRLLALEKNGFSVTLKKPTKKGDTFIIGIKNPKKVDIFLQKSGIDIDYKNIETFKGLKIALILIYKFGKVEIVSYIHTLPQHLKSSTSDIKKKKRALWIEKMVKDKAIKLFATIEYITGDFKGHLKDIDENINDKQDKRVTINGFNFSGNISNNHLQNYSQTIESIKVLTKDANVNLNHFKSNTIQNKTDDNIYKTVYSIDDINISTKPNNNIYISHIKLGVDSNTNQSLVSKDFNITSEKLTYTDNKKVTILNQILLNSTIGNLDKISIDRLIDTTLNKNQFQNLIQKILDNKPHITIHNLDVSSVQHKGLKIDGFNIKSHIKVFKKVSLKSIAKKSLFVFLKKLNVKISISVSKAILKIAKKDPKLKFGLMFVKEKIVNGRVIYDINIKGGSFSIN